MELKGTAASAGIGIGIVDVVEEPDLTYTSTTVEYSVSSTSILATRKQLSLWTREEAQALADKVMELRTAHEVYEALQEAQK